MARSKSPTGDGRRSPDALIVACPICRKSTTFSPENPYRPFCSERCRIIDLGAWASGDRYIPGDPVAGDEFDDEDGY